jgi:RNA polymerase sigma-70 factor (ECF subfamily)
MDGPLPPNPGPDAATVSTDKLTPEALSALERQLTHAVHRLCPAWLANHRDDIVQAALIKVTRLAQGENPAGFTASYIWKVAFSMVVDEIRRHRRRGEETLADSAAAELPHAAPDPEREAAGRQIGRAIRACMDGLGDDRRLAVTLHLQGHSIAEASGYLGWPAKRIANLTYRGLGDLRRCLAAKGYSL